MVAFALTKDADFYVLVFPAIFGFFFAFVFGLGVYQCATARRLTATYRRRNCALQSRLSQSLANCDQHDITSFYDTLRSFGYADLCNMIGDKSGSLGNVRSQNILQKSNGNARDSRGGESEDSPDYRRRHSRTPSQRHRPSNAQRRHSRSQSVAIDEESSIGDI